MHQKKRKLFVLYSISIWFRKKYSKLNLCKEKLYLVSYSIPLSCMVVLLLGLSVMVNPSLCINAKTNAITVADSDRQEQMRESDEKINIEPNMESGLEEESGIVDNVGDDGNFSVRTSTNTEPYASSTAAISIGGAAADATVDVGAGDTAYRAHEVTITVDNAKDYALSIAGPTNMTLPPNAELPVTGASNQQGSAMLDNTWGYSWGIDEAASDNIDNDDRYYRGTLPTGESLTVPGLNDNQISFSRKLVFAAKFSSKAVLGLYSVPVSLSLAVTPNEIGALWKNVSGGTTSESAGTTTMQGISSGFCKDNANIEVGWTVSLIDARDEKTYTVVKLRDGNCWMQEGLAFYGNGKPLTSADTDNPLNGSWNELNTSWEKGNQSTNTNAMVKAGTVDGGYYNWCAATAGTCAIATQKNDIATGSICPRGWKLPTLGGEGYIASGQGVGQFGILVQGLRKYDLMAAPYNFVGAGFVYLEGTGLANVNSSGNYWSSVAYSQFNALYLSFYAGSGSDTNYFAQSYNATRANGYPIRCIAAY